MKLFESKRHKSDILTTFGVTNKGIVLTAHRVGDGTSLFVRLIDVNLHQKGEIFPEKNVEVAYTVKKISDQNKNVWYKVKAFSGIGLILGDGRGLFSSDKKYTHRLLRDDQDFSIKERYWLDSSSIEIPTWSGTTLLACSPDGLAIICVQVGIFLLRVTSVGVSVPNASQDDFFYLSNGGKRCAVYRTIADGKLSVFDIYHNQGIKLQLLCSTNAQKDQKNWRWTSDLLYCIRAVENAVFCLKTGHEQWRLWLKQVRGREKQL